MLTRAWALGIAFALLPPAALPPDRGTAGPVVPARTRPAPQSVEGPVWPKPDRFWYRKPLPGGNVWIVVDARHGVKEPLFDHQRLATELNLRTGEAFAALTLPFADAAARFVMKYDGSNAYVQEGARAIEFVLYGYDWRCDLDNKWDWNKVPPTDYECRSLREHVRDPAGASAGAAAEAAARRSPDGAWEAFIDGHDVAIRPAGGGDPIRITSDGAADFAYQLGSILWSDDARRLGAWRVSAEIWRSDALAGSVKDLLARGEWPVPSLR
jgi:hypothetical protein